MSKLKEVFRVKGSQLLSVYFTAGFPRRDDTLPVMAALNEAGADIIEIGIPFSDPVADGPTIQESNKRALENGMTMELLFEQLKELPPDFNLPLILMGYLNPVLQYGIDNFVQSCRDVGVSGLIIPDLPLDEYVELYKEKFQEAGIDTIFLVTPQTSDSRIREIDENSGPFIYLVSSSSITGARKGISEEQVAYFERIRKMELKNPTLVGFGISDNEGFEKVCEYSSGAIIGSAFINTLSAGKELHKDIVSFINRIKS